VTRALAAAALTVVLALGVALPAAASGPIRVALVNDVRVVELRGADIEVSELGACPRCQAPSRRVAVVRAIVSGEGVEIEGTRAGGFRLRSDLPIRLNGREYTPPLDIVRNGTGLTVVNELPLEEYLDAADLNDDGAGAPHVYTYVVEVDPGTTGQGPAWTALLKSVANQGNGEYFAVSSADSGACIASNRRTIRRLVRP